MPSTALPLTGGFYVSRSLPISAQNCSNMYVNINTGGGLAEESLFGTPGSVQLATSGINQQTNRGSHEKEGIPYFVNGNGLYRLNRTVSLQGAESFDMELLGIIEGEGRVSMANNNTQLCILVPGGKGYIFDESSGTPFQEITDTNFRANGDPQHVVFVNSFFVFTTDTEKFINSALNDGLSYDALDFTSAEADPDKIIAPFVVGGELYIAGSKTIEPFRLAGGAGAPFVRLQGGVIGTGVSAAFSGAQQGDDTFFIGGTSEAEPSIYFFDGIRAQIISTDAIDVLLSALTEEQATNVFAWSYVQNGSRFFGWVLPTTVIVYDMKAQRWHERKSFDVIDDVASEFRWRINSIVKAYGRLLVGDSLDGRVGELDLDIYDEYGQNIIRNVSTMPFSNIGGPLRFPMIELTIESGVGNVDDPDPKVSMSWSKDGKTFSDPRTRLMGKVGEYIRRVIWRRNGRFPRMAILNFTSSDKVKQVWIKLEGNAL